MADKMMRTAGRNPNGIAKAIQTNIEGTLLTQESDVMVIFENEALEAQGEITSHIVNKNGIYNVSVVMHSVATFDVIVEYLEANDSIAESEVIHEQATSVTSANFEFEPKRPRFRIKIQSNYPSNRNVWVRIEKLSREPFFDLIDEEKNSIIEVFDNVDVAAQSSITSDKITNTGENIKIGMRWSSATNMFMSVDVEYLLPGGTVIESENLLYSRNSSGENYRMIDFIPKFNLFRLKATNSSENDRRISLSMSKQKESKINRLKRNFVPLELRSGSNNFDIAIPEEAYGVTFYLINKNHTSGRNASLQMRAQTVIYSSTGSINNSITTGGWLTEEVLVDGKAQNAVMEMNISPEAMYLKEYPYEYTSFVLDTKFCPYKLTCDKIILTVYAKGDFVEGEGVEYEIEGYWHV